MLKLPSRSGSLMSPFQPTVVRGFSKYTRITISSASPCVSRSGRSRRAYSSAALASWIEHGPITTARRSSSPCRIRCSARRALATLSDIGSVHGSSRRSSAGVDSGAKLRMRRSSVEGGIFFLPSCPSAARSLTAQKSRQVRWRLSGVSSLFSSSNRSRPVLRLRLRIAVKPEPIAGRCHDHGRH